MSHSPPRPPDRRGIPAPPGSMQALSETVLAFIRAYIAERGYPPTISEMARGVGLSRSGVYRHLDRLEMQGRLFREPYLARGISLLDDEADR